VVKKKIKSLMAIAAEGGKKKNTDVGGGGGEQPRADGPDVARQKVLPRKKKKKNKVPTDIQPSYPFRRKKV